MLAQEFSLPVDYALSLKVAFTAEAASLYLSGKNDGLSSLFKKYLEKAAGHKDPVYVQAAVEELTAAAAELGLPLPKA
jgi:hypothetical protein